MAIYLGNLKIAINTIAPLKPVILRPDAELISTYSLNHRLVTDDEITFPTYTTTNTVLINAETLTTITPDYDTYDYFVEEKMLTIPEYSITTLAKGRQEYGFTISCYLIGRFPGSTFHAITGGKMVTLPSFPVTNSTIIRHIYYSSASAVTAYTAVTYGINLLILAPTANDSSIVIKSPLVIIRGHSTYFVNTFFNALTECRRLYIIRVYRVAKTESQPDGWNMTSHMNAIVDDINNNNYTLR